MLDIYVDGDACPVKDEVVRVAARYSLHVIMVSNRGLREALGPNVKSIMVGPEFDAADNWIVEHLGDRDIVVTADIQLAAHCLKKGAKALGPNGHIFSLDNIGSALAMRELKAYLREAGTSKGFNAAFTKKDRSQFLQSLDLLIQKIRQT
ncbi:MAG: YaiI/YqxD family protein [Pseudomonadota bacterium]|nr:YaiI/YqxD family protein [Pseudomonadota bacterium]